MCHPSWARARIAAQRLDEFARLRRVRDRIDREYARPLDVEALARVAGMPVERLSRQFRAAYGMFPCDYRAALRAARERPPSVGELGATGATGDEGRSGPAVRSRSRTAG